MPVFAICGPSGAGKDTLIDAARAACPDIHVARRVITRPAEAGGEDFTPATEAEFGRMARAGAFALWWRAHGLCYGVPVSAIDRAREGRAVVFNASRAALAEAARVFPDLRVILITARPEVLAARLAARGREGAADIARRLARAAAYRAPEGLPVTTIGNDGAVEDAARALIAALQPRGAR